MISTSRRFLLYVFGIMILTLGIALTIQSRLGTSPFDALLVGLFRTVGLTIGTWEIVVGLSMVIFNAIAMRKRPEMLALLTSFVTGVGIDIWVFLLRQWLHPSLLIEQSFFLAAGLILSGLGISIYLQADFAPIPMDRMMLVVRDLTGLSVSKARMIINMALIILAFLFHGPIGVGTVITVFLSGAVIHFFMNTFDRLKAKQLNQVEL